jgi:uncharacterized protein YhfF/rhodanese-related sulfurtransferase
MTARMISAEQLASDMASSQRLWLVHAPGPADLQRAHIPGAIAFTDPSQAAAVLDLGDDIVVYGHHETCPHSHRLMLELIDFGYPNFRWLRGGLRAWRRVGGTIEGSTPQPQQVDEPGLSDLAAAYFHTTGQPLPDDRFAFGDDPALADELALLVLIGRKRATTSLLADYQPDDEPLPRPGDRAVVLDGEGHEVGVIETTAVAVKPFADVDEAFAHDEGEGDRTLASWRTDHEHVLRRRCDTLGITFSPQLEVVCEHFRLIHPPPATR